MAEIIGIRFKSVGKVYYFAAAGKKANLGDLAIVETARGIECGEVALSNREIPDAEITAPLKEVIRMATKDDLKTLEKNKRKEQDALRICEEKIAYRKLDMKLVDVECTFDNSKLLFYFTAEARVDFRELVKDLASVFRTRIELRQIGVRDEAKILGGLGICGREFCCKGYLGDFQPVSIKMAKEQGLSLNPAKISGTCGRLMCCLKHEQSTYEQLLKITPKAGCLVSLPDGNTGIIEEVNLISGKLKVKPDQADVPVTVGREEVTVLREPCRGCKDESRAAKADKSENGAAKDKERPQKDDRKSAKNADGAARENHRTPRPDRKPPRKPEPPKPQNAD